MKNSNKSFKVLAVSIVLCLVSMIGASLVQSSWGNITIKEMSWESPSGHQLSAYLYKPVTATKDIPAPAVITIEGWYNNKEMQDAYTVELARRGYVVLSLDMHSHGNSESLPADKLYDGAVGVDGGVQLIASLPYVDKGRIGITGHSSGGTAGNMAVEIDNKREAPLIKSIFLQAADWQDDRGGDHSGDYGNRSVGIIASKHDDFYFGTYDNEGNMLTAPKDFIQTYGAKKFLNFNEDISTFSGKAEPEKYYTRNINGVEAIRVIHTPSFIHPWVTFSKQGVSYAVDFFEKTLGAPNSISGNQQVWQWKALFNLVGLVGFFMFMISFTIAMLETKYFGVLKAEQEVEATVIKDKKGLMWFWVGLLISAVFSGFSFLIIMALVYSHTTNIFTQTGPLTIGVWSAVCGIFSVIVMTISYKFYGKKHGLSLKDRGIVLNREKVWKTILLSIIVIVCSFNLVFFAQYFFKTDFRFWVLAVKAFQSDKVLIALRYLPLFLIFYVINSISVNCFNYNSIGGKKSWGNIAIVALFNSLGCIVIVAIQYVAFFSTGFQVWRVTEGDRIGPIWLFPVIVILFLAAIISRIIYKKTRNPYLAGIINAMFVTMISCSNTTTILGAATLIATTF